MAFWHAPHEALRLRTLKRTCDLPTIGATKPVDEKWRTKLRVTQTTTCAVGIGIGAKWGSAPVTNTRFEGIDIERVNGNSWGNLAWWHGWIQNVDGTGGAPITGVYIKNIKVRDAGNTAAALEGLNSTSRIDTVTFENVVMPGQTTRATTLAQMNVTSVQFATNITALNEAKWRDRVGADAPAALEATAARLRGGRRYQSGRIPYCFICSPSRNGA